MKQFGNALAKLHIIPSLNLKTEFAMGFPQIKPFLKEMENNAEFLNHKFIK
jgi:hypothetical protein